MTQNNFRVSDTFGLPMPLGLLSIGGFSEKSRKHCYYRRQKYVAILWVLEISMDIKYSKTSADYLKMVYTLLAHFVRLKKYQLDFGLVTSETIYRLWSIIVRSKEGK